MSAELHTLTGAYAVDGLAADERMFFERHLHSCQVCRGEVDELQATAAALGAAVDETPPAPLRRQVLSSVDTTRQLPPLPASDLAPSRSRGRRVRAVLAGVAAVLALGVVALAGVTAQLNERIAQLETAPPVTTVDDDVLAVLTAPDTASIALQTDAQTSVRLLHSAALDRGVVVASGMDPLASDVTYQLWLYHDGEPQPATVFAADGQGRTVTVVDGGVAGAEIAAVTIEPSGGSPQPTGEIVAQGPV